MKKLLLTTALLLTLGSMTLESRADIITSLGVNPTSGSGAFANTNPGTGAGGSGAFSDTYTFSLVSGPQFLTIASVTNTFASSDQFISNFTGRVLNSGANGVPGGGDDTTVIGPVLASNCVAVPNCQGFAGSALLNAGSYYLLLTGTAGVNAGYGGNLSTFGVPGPLAGAGLPGLIAACFGLVAMARRRRNRA